MHSTQIERIRQKQAELHRLDPQGSALFGAATTGYQLNPPATEALLQEFEALHQISLPDSYREFLLQIGNGGAGPYYGLYELAIEKEPDPDTKTYKARVAPFSSEPLYSARHYADDESAPAPGEADEAFYAGMKEKALEICTPGSELETFLVLDGPKRGQVWTSDARLAREMRLAFWPETLVDVTRQIRAQRRANVTLTFTSARTNWEPVEVYDINPFGDQDNPDFYETLPENGPEFLDWYEHWQNAGLLYLSRTGGAQRSRNTGILSALSRAIGSLWPRPSRL